MPTIVSDAASKRHATQFDELVISRLRRILGRLRLYVFAQGLSEFCIVVVLCFVVQITLDYLFRLRVDLRATLLFLLVLALTLVAWRRLFRPLRIRISLTDVAQEIEKRFPTLNSSLISALQFAQGQTGPARANSPVLIRHVIDHTARISSTVPMESILDHRNVRVSSARLLGVLAFCVVFSLFAPQALGTYIERNLLLRDVHWKQNTYLMVLNDEDHDGIIYTPRGDDLQIRLRAEGVVPGQVRISLAFESGEREQQPMVQVGADEFRLMLTAVSQPFSFTVSGGDAHNEPVQVALVDRPRVQDATVTIVPPPYINEPPFGLREGLTLMEILPGSEVDIVIRPNKPLQSATLLREQSPLGQATRVKEGYQVRFRPQTDATYSFELLDENELRNIRPRPFVVHLITDQPPSAQLVVANVGDLVTTQAKLKVEMQFEDRYGIAEAALVYSVSDIDNSPVRQAIDELQPGIKQLLTTQELLVADTGATEGMQLMLRAEATDLNDIGGPGVGRSAEYAFRVVSAEELLAELSRREQEFRQEFERLIEMQERLRNDALSAANRIDRSQPAENTQVVFAAFERRQRRLSRQVGGVARQFEGMLNEFIANQLASTQVHERLGAGIVQPLNALSLRQMPEAADALDQLKDAYSPEEFATADTLSDMILAEMRRILVNMSKWEGFHETISMLQTIIKMQRDLQKETDDILKQQIEEFFDE